MDNSISSAVTNITIAEEGKVPEMFCLLSNTFNFVPQRREFILGFVGPVRFQVEEVLVVGVDVLLLLPFL